MAPNSVIVTGHAFTFGGKYGSKELKKKNNPDKSNITAFGLSPKKMYNLMQTLGKEY